MVLGLGMDPEVGAVSYIDAQEEVFLASERQGIRQRVQQLSPAKSEQAYRSAVGLLWSMESYALGMLRENQGALAALTDLLLEKRHAGPRIPPDTRADTCSALSFSQAKADDRGGCRLRRRA